MPTNKLKAPAADPALWSVELRCAFFKGKIQSAKVLRSCGNKTVDAQAVKETVGRHVPEVSFGTRRHEYWRNITWTMLKASPASVIPPFQPVFLVGVPFDLICSVSAPCAGSAVNEIG